ncbi:MAG: glycosyltransferase family 1 protein [Gemmataceae bacterium]
MRLGINARRLEGQRLGVGRYIEYLLKHWQGMVGSDDRVELFVRSPLAKGDDALTGPFQTHHLRPRLTGLLWENLILSRAAKGLDVLFGPSYTLPLNHRGPCVVATHSVNELRPGAHPWWYRFTYEGIYRQSALKADMVIVPTQATKDDVARHYGIPEEQIAIIPQGADETFQPLDDPALVLATRRKHTGDERPYVLFVGKLSQRRNIPLIMEAFARLKKQTGCPHRLLLFGPNHQGLPLDRLADELGIADSFTQTDGRVKDHSELAAVYGAADLYVFASLYEGFSMTTVEAMACGLPVVAADCPALREVTGGAGILVETADAPSMADAMATVLADDDLRRDMSRRSVVRATAYRWDDVARRTLDVLRRVADGQGDREVNAAAPAVGTVT